MFAIAPYGEKLLCEIAEKTNLPMDPRFCVRGVLQVFTGPLMIAMFRCCWILVGRVILLHFEVPLYLSCLGLQYHHAVCDFAELGMLDVVNIGMRHVPSPCPLGYREKLVMLLHRYGYTHAADTP